MINIHDTYDINVQQAVKQINVKNKSDEMNAILMKFF